MFLSSINRNSMVGDSHHKHNGCYNTLQLNCLDISRGEISEGSYHLHIAVQLYSVRLLVQLYTSVRYLCEYYIDRFIRNTFL